MTILSATKLSALRKIIATPCLLGGRAIAIDQVYSQEVPIYARIKDKPDVVRIAEPHNCPPGFIFTGHKQEVRGRLGNVTGPLVTFSLAGSHFLDSGNVKSEFKSVTDLLSGQQAEISRGDLKAKADEWKLKLTEEEALLEEYTRSREVSHDTCTITANVSCVFRKIGPFRIYKSGGLLDAVITLKMRRVGTVEDLQVHLGKARDAIMQILAEDAAHRFRPA